MTPEDDRRIADIFEQAVELPAAERGAFVERACGNELTIRREVEALLVLDAEAEAGNGSPSWSPSRAASRGILGATGRVGPYRLLGKLGEGGMSEVFLGLRDDGEFVRRVAVKLIRKDVLTAETMRRFETERQILASLDHPAIARLLDAGRIAEGVPYFIMEYIDGEPIDLYCDRHRLTVAERLGIFRQVCLAVHFAHQNLVIHRDIKPSNILVTEAGQPKLLDFGIAKLLNPDLMIRGSEPTVSWGRLLTPEYASPEQILGKSVTAASDVYALGVLLFKLLTGADPYRLRERPAPELEQLILTVDPDTPSACIQRSLKRSDAPTARELADLRSTKPRALVRALAGDLDAVTAKALRKEPQNRYISAEHMAEDLRRHLAGGRPAAANRSGFPGRWWLMVGVALALALVAVTGLLVLQSVRLADMRAVAERERARAAELPTSWQRIFAERFRQDFTEQPEIHANLLMALGRSYFQIGLFDEAASSLQEALEIRRRTLGSEHEKVAESLTAMALVDAAQGDYDGAKTLHTKALALRRKLHPGDSLEVTESLVGLARVLLAKGHPPQAEPLLLEAVKTREKLLIDGDVRFAEALTDLGHVVDQLGSPSAAEILFGRASKIYQRSSETWVLAVSLVNQAGALFELGRREEGEELLRGVVRIERERCGGESADLKASLINVSSAAIRGSSVAETAGDLWPSDLRSCQMPRLAEPHLSYLLQGLGNALMALGDPVQSRSLLEKAKVARMPATPPLQPNPLPVTGDCVPDGVVAEAFQRPCCSGVVASGTTFCSDPIAWGDTWRTCRYICGSRLVAGCVPSGGVSDILGLTDCCSGASVHNTGLCLNPEDAGTTWRTCVFTCR